MGTIDFEQPSTRAFDDVAGLRTRIYDNVQNAYSSHYPIENTQYKLELTDLKYGKEIPTGYDVQKKAIMGGKTLHRPLNGTWRLTDKLTGEVVDERPNSRVAMVPHITDRGTFIYNGVEYSLANQVRLKAGVYTRRKENQELESHFNVMPGSGPSFRVFMDPETGVFNINVGQSKIPLYTILKSLGVSDRQMADTWGRDLFASNRLKDNTKYLTRFYEKLINRRGKLATGDRKPGDISNMVQEIRDAMTKMRLDPKVTQETLGHPYESVNPDILLRATRKLVGISRGEEETDDRDNIAYQSIWGPEDLIAERITRDAGRASRDSLWKTTWRRNLDHIVNTNARTQQIQNVLLESGLGQAVEETNPLDVADQMNRVSRMGAGGIGSSDSIPDEARSVQPSFLAFIDPIRTSESMKAGVDNRLAYKTLKGDDGQLYTPMVRNGKTRLVPSSEASRMVIAFPGESGRARSEGRKARAMFNGKLMLVDPDKIDYEVPSHEDILSPHAHLVPLVSALKGHRMLMASKMFNQSLALRDADTPLVQTHRKNDDDPDDSFEKYFGGKVGAVRSDVEGVVKGVTKGFITLDTADGEKKYPIYKNFPFNRRSFISSTPAVQRGQIVRKGDLLASSNFTDKDGSLAVGKNLSVAYLPYKGQTFEDAIVISEAAADKLTSEHMYQHDVNIEPGQRISKRSFLAKYPTAYPKAIIDKFDDNGVIKPGTTVKKNEPLVLSLSKRARRGQGVLHKSGKDLWSNTSEVWKKDSPGVVTDVHRGSKSVNVVVKSYHPMNVGDKLSGRFGNKGVIASIVSNDKMPRDADGNPIDVLMHPYGVISRSNPAMMLEAALGKIAAKTGKPYKLNGFSDEDYVEFVQRELKKHGMSDTEKVFDPEHNRNINDVFVGNQYFMKLQHTSESKLGARGDEGGYTADMLPGKAKGSSSKRIGTMETSSLLSAGATNVLRDAKLIRGQKNDDFWRAFRMGYPPPTPDIPFVYKKFLADLQGAGINVKKDGNYLHIMAMTDKDVDDISSGKIEKPDTLDFDTMDPIPKGLFDLGKTGGNRGSKWSHVELSEPIPSPVMEEPIRRLLGLTKDKYRQVISGERDIDGLKGGRGIKEALRRIKVDDSIATQNQIIRSGAKSKRDDAIKKLRFLTMFKKTGIKPEELVLTKAPVLPPQYRPISKMSKIALVSDPNLLYKELMLANDNLKELNDELGSDGVGSERLALYDAFKAVVGLGDPLQPKLQQKSVRGILSHAIGLKSSPKFSDFQRKVIGTTTDIVGRATITPNSSLNMDQVGLPENKAWVLYKPFVMRRLVRRGVPAVQAARMIEDKDPRAKEAMVREMENRPVIVNRAPTLHRFGIMAAFPILTKGNTLQVSPLTTSGYGADFDGDAEQFHVPVSDDAVQEAKDKLLPSRNLTDIKSFDVHYVPAQEYLQGLFEATAKPSNKHTRVFRSKQDVINAYRRGEINVNDKIKVL